jgi:hypothetical protein
MHLDFDLATSDYQKTSLKVTKTIIPMEAAGVDRITKSVSLNRYPKLPT